MCTYTVIRLVSPETREKRTPYQSPLQSMNSSSRSPEEALTNAKQIIARNANHTLTLHDSENIASTLLRWPWRICRIELFKESLLLTEPIFEP